MYLPVCIYALSFGNIPVVCLLILIFLIENPILMLIEKSTALTYIHTHTSTFIIFLPNINVMIVLFIWRQSNRELEFRFNLFSLIHSNQLVFSVIPKKKQFSLAYCHT